MTKTKYNYYYCRACDADFLMMPKKKTKKPFCPHCGEKLYIELKRSLAIKRPLQSYRSYTAEEDEEILLGRASGYSFRAIAESLDGRTLASVRARAYRLEEFGAGNARWLPKEDQALLEARARGLQFAEITAILPNRTARAMQARHAKLKGEEAAAWIS